MDQTGSKDIDRKTIDSRVNWKRNATQWRTFFME